MTMPVGGEITGKLYDAVSGAPVEEATVEAISSGGAKAAFQLHSGEGGAYTLNRLEGGTYSVKVIKEGGQGGAYETYATSPFPVGLGATVPLNVPMFPPAGVSGEVTNAITGAPLAGITVSLYDAAGNVAWSVPTASNGSYSHIFYEKGVGYKIGFSGGGFATQFYKARASLACADPLTLPGHATTSEINAAMTTAGASLTCSAGGGGGEAPKGGGPGPGPTFPTGGGSSHVGSSGGTVGASGGSATVIVQCVGEAPCTVEVVMTSSPSGHAASVSKLKRLTLGRAKRTIPAGRTERIRIKLTPAALKLLRAHHGRIHARLTITGKGGTSAITLSKVVLLVKRK